jgi:glutathione S-transferase
MTDPRPELVSYRICPFGQRAVIVLREKGVDFTITHLEPGERPDWFLALSPLGKVPVLRVGDTAIFESSVINEYLDEVYPPRLHPAGPLDRARHRAWIEFAAALLADQFAMMSAPDEGGFREALQKAAARLDSLEQGIDPGPYFDGAAFSLVDAAFAPAFMRLDLLALPAELDPYRARPKIDRWRRALAARDSVRDSVVEDFPERFGRFFGSKGGVAVRFLAGADGDALQRRRINP